MAANCTTAVVTVGWVQKHYITRERWTQHPSVTKLGSLQVLACAFISCARPFTPPSRIKTLLYCLAHWPWERSCPELCSPDCDKANWSQAAFQKVSFSTVFESTWKNWSRSGDREMFALHVCLRLELAGWTSFISQPQAWCNEHAPTACLPLWHSFQVQHDYNAGFSPGLDSVSHFQDLCTSPGTISNILLNCGKRAAITAWRMLSLLFV